MIAVSLAELPNKEQQAHAHELLAECLRGRGIEYRRGETPLTLGEHGKPSLAEHPDVHYNLSHARGITACIVTDCECGIDCEKVRPCRMGVAKRAYSLAEREFLEAAPEAERDILFFRIWTLKEAFVKAIGVGISYPMSGVTFTLEDGRISSDISGFYFAQYIINGAGIVSVCTKKAIPQTVTHIKTEEKRLIYEEP